MEEIAYFADDHTKTVFIPVKKVAHSALVKTIRFQEGRSRYIATAQECWNTCKNYTILIFVREPMDRFNSFYRSKNPPTDTGETLINQVFNGKWTNDSHTVPIMEYVGKLWKRPDIVLRYENIEEDFKIFRERFPLCKDLAPTNVSPQERDIWRDYDIDTLKRIRSRYICDYENFNYPIPTIEE